jgi:hypothetical protein
MARCRGGAPIAEICKRVIIKPMRCLNRLQETRDQLQGWRDKYKNEEKMSCVYEPISQGVDEMKRNTR